MEYSEWFSLFWSHKHFANGIVYVFIGVENFMPV